MRTLTFTLVLLSLVSLGLAGPLVAYTRNSTLKVTREDGTVLLELAPGAWGPIWGYVNLKGEYAVQDGQTVGRFTGVVPGSGANCEMVVVLRDDGPRSLRIEATFSADRDTAL